MKNNSAWATLLSALLCATVLACSSSETMLVDGGATQVDTGTASIDTGTPSIDPAFAALSAPNWWLPPRDVTNNYADNRDAARLGQQFFFDTGFSGPLLDTDNDGTAGSVGHVGETGKVSCASCHVAQAGF